MTDSVKIKSPPHDPIASTLSAADDRIVLSHWLPSTGGYRPPDPHRSALDQPAMGDTDRSRGTCSPGRSYAEFAGASEHPGIHRALSWHGQAAPSLDSGFPGWLQLQHFLNMLFMMFIIRAGIQILADHPRLYWNRDCTLGTEWCRFRRPVPEGRIWTSKDDSVTLPTWLGIPGLRHTIGLARWWHFSVGLLWIVNGIAFYVLLFWTDRPLVAREQLPMIGFAIASGRRYWRCSCSFTCPCVRRAWSWSCRCARLNESLIAKFTSA
jgi:sulfoxide reductase catalytic subunit YedY